MRLAGAFHKTRALSQPLQELSELGQPNLHLSRRAQPNERAPL